MKVIKVKLKIVSQVFNVTDFQCLMAAFQINGKRHLIKNCGMYYGITSRSMEVRYDKSKTCIGLWCGRSHRCHGNPIFGGNLLVRETGMKWDKNVN